MRVNILAEKLRAGKVVLGLCNMYPASGIIEGMCPGWDFVWIDGQHGEMSYDACLHAVQAAMATDVETLLRVPGREPGMLGKFADLCPSAVMVPIVDNAAQAMAVVKALRFPPLGERSYGGRRVIDLDGREYYRERELLVVAQIETLDAVDNARDIIGTEGIDVLFFGPDDMKMRMGLPINTAVVENEQLRNALERTARAACDAGKFAAGVSKDGPTAEMMVGMGYRMLAGGGDIAFLRTMAAQKLSELTEAVEGAAEKPKDGGSSGVY